jgi:protein phosphatase
MVRASGTTDRGRVRPTNEDCFGIDHELQLYVVADGMGGHAAGEVAARLAVETILDYVANRRVTTTWPHGYDRTLSERANLLRTALLVANTRVYETAASSPALAGMGTTVVAASIVDARLTVAHVGDSRLYTVGSGALDQVTGDDTWAAVMLAHDPTIDPEILRTHPMRNALTSVIGSRPDVSVHLAERRLGSGDLVLLTTDGVHGVLSDTAIVAACGPDGEPEAVAARLVRAALEAGSRDNCTALVVRYEPAA